MKDAARWHNLMLIKEVNIREKVWKYLLIMSNNSILGFLNQKYLNVKYN